MSYLITHHALNIPEPVTLEITVEPLEKLHHHEETIPASLDTLMEEFRRTGVQQDPIIVDRESKVILDGTHRCRALETLGCNAVVVCYVDYMLDCFLLESWYRIYPAPTHGQVLLNALQEDEEFRPGATQSVERARKNLAKREILTALVTEEDPGIAHPFSLEEGGQSVVDMYWKIQTIEQRIRELSKRELDYDDKEHSMKRLNEGELGMVLMTPPVMKEEVQQFTRGESARLFPPKVTRHVLPARPLGVNVGLEQLKTGRTENTQQEVSEYLERRRLLKIRREEGVRYFEQYTEDYLYLFL